MSWLKVSKIHGISLGQLKGKTWLVYLHRAEHKAVAFLNKELMRLTVANLGVNLTGVKNKLQCHFWYLNSGYVRSDTTCNQLFNAFLYKTDFYHVFLLVLGDPTILQMGPPLAVETCFPRTRHLLTFEQHSYDTMLNLYLAQTSHSWPSPSLLLFSLLHCFCSYSLYVLQSLNTLFCTCASS